MRPNRMLVIAALVTACVLISVPVVGQKTQPVLVVNGSGQPVPTAAQGTTNVAGTVSLASGSTVNVGNTPNVNVSNTPDVNVTNTPTVSLASGAAVNVTNPLDINGNPIPLVNRDVNDPALHAYQESCSADFNGSNFAGCFFQAIPAGKRLVIQEFDAQVTVDLGVKPIYLRLVTDLSVLPTRRDRHYLTPTFLASSDLDYFATHQETRMYAETLSGDTTGPDCQAALTGNSIGGLLNCSISGYFVSIP